MSSQNVLSTLKRLKTSAHEQKHKTLWSASFPSGVDLTVQSDGYKVALIWIGGTTTELFILKFTDSGALIGYKHYPELTGFSWIPNFLCKCSFMNTFVHTHEH